MDICAACSTVGVMAWPVDAAAYGSASSASTVVCDREEHRAAAAAWVEEITGHTGVFIPFR